MKRIVAYHVAFGDVRSDDLAQIDEAQTIEGSVVAIASVDGKFQVNEANERGRIRTCGRLLRRQLLYPLSYAPMSKKALGKASVPIISVLL